MKHGYASIDVYTCGDCIEPSAAADCIEEGLDEKTSKSIELPRELKALKSSNEMQKLFKKQYICFKM